MSEAETPPADPNAAPEGESADQDNGGAKKRRKPMSPITKLVLLGLLAVAIVAGIAWYIRHETSGKFYQETNDATIQADAVTVSPKVSGYVAEVLIADNQDVKVGQPLVRIDPRDYTAKVAQAKAQIAEAGAAVDSARASIQEQYATIEQSRAQLAAARAKAAHDAAEVARYRPLAASGAETRQQLAQLETTARQSAEDVRAQAAALLMQQRRIASFQAQIGQGEAQANGAQAQLSSANVDVNSTLIRASVTGRIGNRTVTVGQYATAGTRLMSVVPLDKLYVVANFKETQLALMRPGQPATISVDALDGTEIGGHVASVSPGTGAQFSLIPPSNATGNFTKIVQRVPVRIAIDATPEARRLLVPGLSVTVTVNTKSAKGELDQIKDQQDRLEKAR
jgi:membrane fusion protein (multidrug efflux system)